VSGCRTGPDKEEVTVRARAVGLAAGFLADRIWGDPARWHPVAGFGTVAARVEKMLYRDRRGAGIAYTATLVGATAALGVVAEKLVPREWGRAVVTAAATWAVLGGRSLEREAQQVARYLTAEDLSAARTQVGRLVGRRTADLTGSQVARAAVESVAENTCDAVVAPLLWGAVAGVPGLLGYRAINTLDAMVGHHNDRYEHFGWAAAKLDDVANYVPARVAATVTGLVAPAGFRDASRATRRTYGDRHPSPNGGQVEAAFAGALGVTLGGRNDYGSHVEERPLLGDGREVAASDVLPATALARRVDLASLAVGILTIGVLARRGRRGGTRGS